MVLMKMVMKTVMKMVMKMVLRKKRKEIVRYLGILGISIYTCEVHGNVLGIVSEF